MPPDDARQVGASLGVQLSSGSTPRRAFRRDQPAASNQPSYGATNDREARSMRKPRGHYISLSYLLRWRPTVAVRGFFSSIPARHPVHSAHLAGRPPRLSRPGVHSALRSSRTPVVIGAAKSGALSLAKSPRFDPAQDRSARTLPKSLPCHSSFDAPTQVSRCKAGPRTTVPKRLMKPMKA